MAARHLNRRVVLAAGLLFAALPLPRDEAFARGPIVEAGSDRAECLAALAMARRAFYSAGHSMLWPVFAPAGFEDAVVLRQDINGFDPWNDPAVFEPVRTSEGGLSMLYWQREPAADKRVALAQWEGRETSYALYQLDAGLSPAEAAREIMAPDQPSNAPEAVTEERFTPPVILRNAISGKVWAIDQGDEHDVLPSWKVVVPDRNGQVTTLCSIAFAPSASPGLTRLPLSLRRFAALADEALGPGSNEGTLQPTAGIRRAVQVEWAYVSDRPWALTDRPYNTRAQVDAGLSTWARLQPHGSKVLTDMRRQYAASITALAGYYGRQFDLTPGEARRFSTFAMDHMLRSYFSFHNEQPDDTAEETPWPEAKRRG